MRIVYVGEFALEDKQGFIKLVKIRASTLDKLFIEIKEHCNQLYIVKKGIIKSVIH